jgi:addiction module HigA family antidote
MNALKLKHPGVLLREEFLEPLNLTVAGVARATGISQPTLSQIVNGRRPLTPDSAVRLAHILGVDAQWFVNLQAHYDLREAERRLAPELKTLQPLVLPLAA